MTPIILGLIGAAIVALLLHQANDYYRRGGSNDWTGSDD